MCYSYGGCGFIDYVMFALIGVVSLMVAAMVLYFLLWLGKIIFFEFHYGYQKRYRGTVTDMDYSPTRVISSGKTTTVIPEKNMVYIKTKLMEDSFNSSVLYQRCRIDDTVYVTYQSIWIRPRFWTGRFTPDGYRATIIECPKNKDVQMNSSKPVSHFAVALDEANQ